MSVIIRIFNLFLVAEQEEKGDYDVLDHNRPMPQVRPCTNQCLGTSVEHQPIVVFVSYSQSKNYG